MRKLVFLLLLNSLASFSQKIENTKAEAVGERIVITYDLTRGEPGDNYTVSIFASHNNFNTPLSKVNGDVGAHVREGTGKRIEWESKLELGKYKGPLTFEIEVIIIAPLTLKTSPASAKRGRMQTIRWRGGDHNQNVKIELLKAGAVQEVVGTPSNGGSYVWNVSPKQKPGKDYVLRLVNGRETVSSSTFAIKPKIPIWVKIGVPLVAVGVLLLPKSGSENSSSARLTAPPEILD